MCDDNLFQFKEAGRTPHILNNSPPLDMRPKWFGMSTAYTIAKYNMSMCALGMAEEFKGEVAVNCIWPQVPIWTAATQMLYQSVDDAAKLGSDFLKSRDYLGPFRTRNFNL